MDQNWGEDVGVTASLIFVVDTKIPSPNTRTLKIYERVKDFSRWDLICFCVGYLASIIPIFPMFGPPVKSLGQMSFLIHYLHPEEVDENYSKLVDGKKDMAGESNGN